MDKRVLLIDEKSVKDISIIDHNVDSGLLSKLIYTVQDTQLKDIIGKALYTELCNEIRSLRTVPNYIMSDFNKELLNKYITPYLAYATLLEFIIINNVKISNKGAMKMTDNSALSISNGDLNYFKERYDNFVETYKGELIRFLHDNNLLSMSADTDTTSSSIGWYLESRRFPITDTSFISTGGSSGTGSGSIVPVYATLDITGKTEIDLLTVQNANYINLISSNPTENIYKVKNYGEKYKEVKFLPEKDLTITFHKTNDNAAPGLDEIEIPTPTFVANGNYYDWFRVEKINTWSRQTDGMTYGILTGLLFVRTINGRFGDVVLNKADVGLSNVDNTSDLDKPISIATQAALDLKQDKLTTGTTEQYFRGDLSLATFPTNVSFFSNDAGYITLADVTGWSLFGNSGTHPSLNFIGTNDAVGLSLRTNGEERIYIDADGNVGIGTNTPVSKLYIQGKDSQNFIALGGSISDYTNGIYINFSDRGTGDEYGSVQFFGNPEEGWYLEAKSVNERKYGRTGIGQHETSWQIVDVDHYEASLALMHNESNIAYLFLSGCNFKMDYFEGLGTKMLTVNNEGFLDVQDIPDVITSLPWSAITDTPTTLAGYGITDAYPLSNPNNYISRIGISASSPLSYNSSTGVISIQQASTSQGGFLSSTDWNTFNGKQAALGYTAANDTAVVHLTGIETISGAKTFTAAGLFQNSTAAVSGNQQASPTLIFEGQGWGTTVGASQAVKMSIDVLPIQNTSAFGKFRIQKSYNGSAYSEMFSVYNPAATNDTVIALNGANIVSSGSGVTQFYGGSSGHSFYNSSGTVSFMGISGTGVFSITPAALTGSTATNAINLTQQWNTTGTPTAIYANITDTASNAASRLLDLQISNVSKFYVDKNGAIVTTGNITATGGSAFSAYRYVSTGGSISAVDIFAINNSLGGTSGTTNIFNTSAFNFAPASGTGVFNGINLSFTINQGSVTGSPITRGIFINPTLTSALDWRSLEIGNSSGFGIYQTSSAIRNYFNGQIGIGVITPSSSALLEVSSTTKGFLPPRMTKTQRDAISSPATGLVVYQTDNTPGLRCYNGTNWVRYTESND